MTTPELERAFALQKELESAALTITDLKNQFLHKDFSSFTDCSLSTGPLDPELLEADVSAQRVSVLGIVWSTTNLHSVVFFEETQISLHSTPRKR